MDFELPEELRLLKENVRRFVDRELIPLEREVVNDVASCRSSCPKRLREKAEALGLWLFDVPEEFGGLGLGMMAKVIVWSEVARTTALPVSQRQCFRPAGESDPLPLEGAAREKYLLPVISGEKRSCFAQTEADAGSDPAAMRTTAVRDGDHYVINGVKRFITGADEADFAQVFAVTDPDKRSRGGISAFLVDMDTPGVKVADVLRSHGRRQALRDRLRERARAGRKSHRQGGRGFPACAVLDQCGPHTTWRAQPRRHGTLPGACASPTPSSARHSARRSLERQGIQWPHRRHAHGRPQVAARCSITPPGSSTAARIAARKPTW